jgi:RNA polymerase sigma-70 factor (ECF subfamily)
MAALDALSSRDREVLVMRYLEQLGAAEIAEALGITEGAVKARLLRALIHVRSRLELEAEA